MGKTHSQKSARVLLIDDCVDTAYLIGVALSALEVDHVPTLAAARKALEERRYDLFLIDVSLPDGDGFRFCGELAADSKWESVPRILLTGKNASADKVFGLNCGADDYITKPFDSPELRARVDAKLRRTEDLRARNFAWRNFEFDSEFQRCFVIENGESRDLGLTPTEFRIFLSMARNEGLPLSRRELVNLVWKNNGLNIEPRGIDSHIRHLRVKLGPHYSLIVSVYGKGYALQSA